MLCLVNLKHNQPVPSIVLRESYYKHFVWNLVMNYRDVVADGFEENERRSTGFC